MNQAKATELLQAAKYDFDHGAFNTLKQAEFFVALAAAIAETPPAPPPPAPAPAPSTGR